MPTGATAPCAIIQGSDEKANGKVQIKDLILGAGLTEIKDREEYLKKQTEAQYEVDEDEAGRRGARSAGAAWGEVGIARARHAAKAGIHVFRDVKVERNRAAYWIIRDRG